MYESANDQAVELLFRGIYHSKRITYTFGKDQAKRKIEKEFVLREILVVAQLALENGPQSATHLAAMEAADGNMEEFLETQSKWLLETAQRK